VFKVNYGEQPFRFAAPHGFRSIRHWVRKRITLVHAQKAGMLFGKFKPTTGDSQLTIENDNTFTVTAGFPSAILQGCLLTSGQWYYEFEILTTGVAQVGWADLDFVGSTRQGQGVGDDKHSWGVDLYRHILWWNGETPYAVPLRNRDRKWKTHDVIGCMLDVDARTISYSLNGSTANGMGVAARNMEFVAGLAPGITLNPCSLRINLGETNFKFPPPQGYESVHTWLVNNNPFVKPSSDDEEILPPLKLHRTASTRTQTTYDSKTITMQANSGYAVAEFRDNNVFAASSNYPSFIAQCPVTTGKWCYQVKILKGPVFNAVNSDAHPAVFGWVDSQFFGDYIRKIGVGDGKHSWGLCNRGKESAVSCKPSEETKLEQKSQKWTNREVLTLGVDADAKLLSFYINSALVATMPATAAVGGFMPGLSISPKYEVQVLFAEGEMDSKLIPKDFRPLHEWFLQQQSVDSTLASPGMRPASNVQEVPPVPSASSTRVTTLLSELESASSELTSEEVRATLELLAKLTSSLQSKLS
jgi:hypothetical protein